MKGIIEQAKRMNNVPLSGIREIVAYANELQSQGRDIIHLELGEPDFDTPVHIKKAAEKALNEGKVHYPPTSGIVELRSALSEKINKDYRLCYKPEEIIVTTGVAQGMFTSIMCFLNEGEEILIPDPGYLSYLYIPNIAGGVIKTYSLTEESCYQVNIEELKKKITVKTKIIVLISPGNPTGSMLTRETLEKIAEISINNNLLVITDEVYSGIIYDDNEHVSIASMPGMKERTIVLNGFSKYYAMTGWRLGYIAAHRDLIDPMMRMCFYNTTSANSFVQWGAVEAILQSDEPSQNMVAEYKLRRDCLVEGLNKIDKLSCRKPDGAFYIFLNIKKTGMNCNDFARYLIDQAGVATVPGTVFGDLGEGYVRISYANSLENIKKALYRIKEAVDKL